MPSPAERPTPPGPGGPLAALFLASALGLFLELLLVRWISTEIRIFAYLQNTVLVVCFLGLGLGCWDARRRPFALRDVLLPLAALTALLAFPPTRVLFGSASELLGAGGGMVIWNAEELDSAARKGAMAVTGAALAAVPMALLWAAFVPLGRLLGDRFNAAPEPVRAYSANVAGSLVGVLLFVGVSAASLPPGAWFGLFAALAIPFAGSGGRSRAGDAAWLAAVVLLGAAAGFEPGFSEVRWSPYQKLAVRPLGGDAPASAWAALGGVRPLTNAPVGELVVEVNNVGYQAAVDLRPETVAARIAALRGEPGGEHLFPPAQKGYSQYDLPTKLAPAAENVLIVGAGSGNDVAGALRGGAKRVTAVEIDPVIIDVGRRLHPERPYSDPRVTVVNDDARSFFATTADRFDLIVFGLLDSHTTTAMTNARLDHYVYTRESLRRAKELLRPGGVVLLSFEAQKGFIADRMRRALAEVFGHEPVAFRVPFNGYGWGGVLFVTGDRPDAEARIAADPGLAKLVGIWRDPSNWGGGAPIPLADAPAEVISDDWPYIYLESRRVPPLYYLLAALMAGLFWLGTRRLGLPVARSWGPGSWHFFFLGAAFMLLEVQNISKAAVVLGNTWEVNAVIISGILLMVLLANLTAVLFPRFPAGLAYAGLLSACVGLYFTDLAAFAFLPYAQKAAAVGLLTSLPMFFSGLVFVRSWAAAPAKDAALGANLFGSLAGALLQSVTFVVGIKALLLLTAGLYALALLTRPRGPAAGAAPEAAG